MGPCLSCNIGKSKKKYIALGKKMRALEVTEKRRGVTGSSRSTLTISQIQLSCEDFSKAVSKLV